MVLLNSNFDIENAEHTGGVTGSARVKHKVKNLFYQLKPSILSNTLMRRFKAGHVDRENFGEVIASKISRSIMSGIDPDSVPEVSLVYNKELKQVQIASKYLTGDKVRTVDGYAKEEGSVFKKHAVFVSKSTGKAKEFNLSGKKNSSLRKGLAYSIALSSIVGDHDVNPGNIMMVDNKVARIDFGHAFNDLVNTAKIFGGRVRNKSNRTLDFINREHVAAFPPPGAQSKLWRDYPGLIPSDEIAQAYHDLSKPDNNVTQGINEAKAEFTDLLNHVKTNGSKKEIKAVTKHVVNSLKAINNSIGGSKIKVSSKNPDKFLDKVFDNLGEFYSENRRQMRGVSKLLKLQSNIDKTLEELAKSGKEPTKKQLGVIRAQYNELKQEKGIGKRSWWRPGIRWAKCEQGSRAHKGSLRSYIKSRAKQLGVDKSLAKDFANKAKYAKPIKDDSLSRNEPNKTIKKGVNPKHKPQAIVVQANLPQKIVSKPKSVSR